MCFGPLCGRSISRGSLLTRAGGTPCERRSSWSGIVVPAERDELPCASNEAITSTSFAAPVRIGVDLTSLTPEPTGVDTYIRNLVLYLSRLDRVNSYRLFVNREDRALFNVSLPRNFRVVQASLRPRPTRLIFQQAVLPLATSRLDVLHSPSFVMPLIRGRARHLLTIHDTTFFSLPGYHTRFRRSHAFRRAVIASIRRADRVGVLSTAVKRDVLELVPTLPSDRIDVIPPGIDESFRPRPQEEIVPVLKRLGVPNNYLLYVGTIQPRKNLEGLVTSYRDLIRSRDRPEHLVLAGKLGWYYKTLLGELEAPELRGRVHLTGYVSDDDLPRLYAGAQLFVFPSWAEGFGFPPLEAMACGVPTIASDTPALAENLSGAAELVPPDSPELLTEAMNRLLSDAELRHSRRKQGLARAASFRWEEAARQTIACYERLAALR
jgi:glycosyltransferase involved in cell wall biosynthesis